MQGRGKIRRVGAVATEAGEQISDAIGEGVIMEVRDAEEAFGDLSDASG